MRDLMRKMIKMRTKLTGISVRETDKQGASSSDAGKMRKMHKADRHQRERNR
jgi:hypothetical protein